MRHEPVQDCVVLEGADDAEVSVFYTTQGWA
jgi:hypothetical protein